eukprot:TRINITY_DN8894_c0_g1_i1.p1 TRINITY_DN8894_c0_g1~~TRINITY_DN8894_c0_g1_i1.p1  ORF type:complete len:131 (-),score=29.95 TRINITY_DN8894_c0_g1_i1:65-457(-)
MADFHHQTGFGLSADARNKLDSKWDSEVANAVSAWIKSKTGEDIGNTPESFFKSLQSGVLLLNLLNVLRPGSVKAPQQSKMAFKQMENISAYLAGCGLPSTDLFQTVDLFEQKNMSIVLMNLKRLKDKFA